MSGPYRVGLTGGIGSGKTAAAGLFGEFGVTVVDTDQIAHELTGANGDAMPAIQAEFGAGVVTAEGALDRAVMRSMAFADTSVRRRLENILHPRIANEVEQRCEKAVSPYVLVAVPLLLEAKGWLDRVDRVLVVDCDESIQVDRVMKRNGLAADEVRAILAAQAGRATRLAAADDVLDNSAGWEKLRDQVEKLHSLYLRLAAKKDGANKPEAKC